MLIHRTELLDSLICLGAFALLALLVIREIERARLASIARAIVRPSASDEDAALCLAREIFLSARRRRQSVPGPGLSASKLLKAGPLTARRSRGKTSSGLPELYVALLDAVGIKGRQIALYHRDGAIQHQVVEVALQSGNVIIDVEYGVSYRDFWGECVALEQLQRGAQPWFEPLPGLDPNGPGDSYYQFDFPRATAATDTEGALQRLAFRLLNFTTLGHANRLSVRPALEWPHVVASLFGLPVLAVLTILRLIIA